MKGANDGETDAKADVLPQHAGARPPAGGLQELFLQRINYRHPMIDRNSAIAADHSGGWQWS
jgi:hypothetical protein